MTNRGCGVLLHPGSLPDSQGEGCFSQDCFRFIDFLASAGFRYWQVLPLGPMDRFGSPYAPVSVFAGNTDFVNKNKALEKLYKESPNQARIKSFIRENKYWIESYADFMAEREKGERDFYIFSQMVFFEAWAKVKEYANDRGISIIGDLPFYTAMDSADVWANRNLFDFEGVAGVPPDYFSKDGQRWGNPLYDFKKMARDKYKWWTNRIKHALQIYDVVRIDHFRAFDEYYSIPCKEVSAKNGSWKKGPGIKFFDVLKDAVPNAKIILEDLGETTASVQALADTIGYPGMRVLQFGFDGNPKSPHLPANYTENCVAYLGTHDNDTFIGFLKSASKGLRGDIDEYLSSYNLGEQDTTRLALENILQSRSNTVILSMQDLLFQDSKSRMNTPGTVHGNWKYKIKPSDLTEDLARYLRMLIERSGRLC